MRSSCGRLAGDLEVSGPVPWRLLRGGTFRPLKAPRSLLGATQRELGVEDKVSSLGSTRRGVSEKLCIAGEGIKQEKKRPEPDLARSSPG